MDGPMVYDVTIVGGGPAGCATALSLLRNKPDASIVLVDDADPSAFKVGESLPAEARRVLDYLSADIPEHLRKGIETGVHLHSSGNASAWQTSEVHESSAITSLWGMGYHLDRATFDSALRTAVQAAQRTSGTGTVIHGRCTSVEQADGLWRVEIEDLAGSTKSVYLSKRIVDATGRKASIARKIGARTVKSDDLLAFYVVFTNAESGSRDQDHRTLVEAVDAGWFYTSQLSGERRLVVYHTDGNDPSSKTARTQEGFLDLMRSQTTHISRLITTLCYEVVQEPGVSYPRHTAAYSSRLSPVEDEDAKWSAVGDAAMAFDPLSSQGMLTALRAGSVLGLELAHRLSGTGSPRRSMADVYEVIGKDYESKKALHYGSVQRFDTAFWLARKQS